MVEYLIEVGKIRLVKKGMEKLPVGEPFLIVCNHKSRYDPMIISQEIKNPRVLQISKPGNFKIPICGPVINRICYIPIDRENNRKAVKAINRAVNFMVNDGFSIGIAPEGHRYFGEGLDDFKPGAFKIAYKAKAPVVVCTFTNTEKVHKRFLFKRTEVDMHIVKTIPYEEYKDLSTRELAYNVRRLMVEDLNLGETEDESKLHII